MNNATTRVLAKSEPVLQTQVNGQVNSYEMNLQDQNGQVQQDPAQVYHQDGTIKRNSAPPDGPQIIAANLAEQDAYGSQTETPIPAPGNNTNSSQPHTGPTNTNS